MVDSTISRLRMRDLARLGRSRAGHRPARGPLPAASASRRRVLTDASGIGKASSARPQSGQITPRSHDLAASPI
jgi:hypothetical protein